MADKRPFFKLDVGYFDNPKIQALMDDFPRAILLHLECIAYSRQHLTDGLVPVRIAMRTVCASHEDRIALTEAGLLVDVDQINVTVHDYSEHNQTAADVNRRSQAASVGAAARWASESHSKPHSDSHGKTHANRNAEKRREESNSSSEIASDPDPDPKSIDDAPRPEVVELCGYLAEKVRANGHDAKVGKLWHRACRLLIDRDHHTPEQIRKAIDWATADPFWSTNIRSMQTLREKYSTLRAQAAQRPTSPTSPEPREPHYVPSYHGDPDDLDAYQRWYATNHSDPSQVAEYHRWYAVRHPEAS